ncbi:PEP/pyruvate-binding domain-containing protein [Candidatus Babeliales bacterium]|nr:PEP/pyruvate-binding domain-containing protein [Candidatus Babeliales bacterium]
MVTLSKSLNKFRLIFALLLCGLSSYNIFSMEQALAPTSVSTQQHSFDIQNFLNQHAVEQKLGYKTANLILLDNQIVRDISFYQELINIGYEIKIPEFIGISSEQAKQFINLNIPEQWQQIIYQISDHTGSEPIEINPAQINNDNFDFFTRKTDELAKQIINSQLTESYHENLAQFLTQAQEKNWYLGCRSTGLHEDTDEQSNAGGNESVMNIMPNIQAVQIGMQTVIASYFKSKSLNQRKNFGDQNIFELPETPVLIQRMIGEETNGTRDINKIPVGCVVYTQEPFANTPGIIFIQASFGHNAGVVDSKVGIDSYFVDDQNNIFRIIKKKPNRLVPTNIDNKFDLSFMANPEEIQNIPCLQDNDVIAIKAVAQKIHNFYGKPMDIELVFEKNPETNLKTINLVQARPLHLTQNFNPQYLESTENLDLILCSTVSPADCSIRHITNKNQIIFSQTLEQALSIFNQANFDQNQIKAVLVTEQAETNSHAAAIFRRACLPIIEIKDQEKIKSWLKSQNTSLFIDVQRGVIINSQPEQINVINGYFKHPAPIIFFIPNYNIENFITQNHTSFFDQDTDSMLFEKLKIANQDVAQKALETLLFRIKQNLDNIGNLLSNRNKYNIARNYFALIKNLYAHALTISNIITRQNIFKSYRTREAGGLTICEQSLRLPI